MDSLPRRSTEAESNVEEESESEESVQETEADEEQPEDMEEAEGSQEKPKNQNLKKKKLQENCKEDGDKGRYDSTNQLKTLIVMQVLGDTKSFLSHKNN